MSKWYGSLSNRLEENRQFVPEITVGTGVTEYMWSDREAYEVTRVIDQKHVYIRRYDHRHVGEPMTNVWELISNPENPEYYVTKRGNYWYFTVTLTREDLEHLEQMDNDAWYRITAAGFDYDKVREHGKQTKYTRANISFGVADYYYDYSF